MRGLWDGDDGLVARLFYPVGRMNRPSHRVQHSMMRPTDAGGDYIRPQRLPRGVQRGWEGLLGTSRRLRIISEGGEASGTLLASNHVSHLQL
jgi:hypothetical protein